jgi:hypothetical protein
VKDLDLQIPIHQPILHPIQFVATLLCECDQGVDVIIFNLFTEKLAILTQNTAVQKKTS